MKTLILTIFLSLYIGLSLSAQDLNTMDEGNYYHLPGKHHINLSVGTLNTTNFAFSVFGGSGSGDPSPSINLEYMYGLSKDFGIGAHFNFYRVDAQQNINLTELSEDLFDDPLCVIACATGIGLGGSCNCSAGATERIEVFTFAVKGAYHIKRFKNLDTYTSFIAGYSINRRKTVTEQLFTSVLDQLNIDQVEAPIPSFVYAGSAGIRYYFSPSIALYGEYGLGNVHTLRIGATYRFMGDSDINEGSEKRKRRKK